MNKIKRGIQKRKIKMSTVKTYLDTLIENFENRSITKEIDLGAHGEEYWKEYDRLLDEAVARENFIIQGK